MGIIFLDFEASSLYSGSYPIEVAWCSHDLLRGGSMLIQPVRSWTDWSATAENLHGLARGTLEAKGQSPGKVMDTLNAELAGEEVISDNPEFDANWLGVLSKASFSRPTFTFNKVPLDAVLVGVAQQTGNPSVHPLAVQLMAKEVGLRNHAALDDCIRHALRMAVIMIAARERDQGDQAAQALRSGLVERARQLLASFGRQA